MCYLGSGNQFNSNADAKPKIEYFCFSEVTDLKKQAGVDF